MKYEKKKMKYLKLNGDEKTQKLGKGYENTTQ